MASSQPIAIAFVVIALAAGIGVLLVRTVPSEAERLSALFPGVRLLQHGWVRASVAILCFGVGFLGVATSLDWL